MKPRGVNITITSLVFTHESGDCPPTFSCQASASLSQEQYTIYVAHLVCSLVDLKVNFLSENSAQIWILKLAKCRSWREKKYCIVGLTVLAVETVQS